MSSTFSTTTDTHVTSVNTGVILTTEIIPPVHVVGPTIHSQDSNTSSADTSCSASPIKLTPQASNDLATNNEESDEMEDVEKEMMKQLKKPSFPTVPATSGTVPIMAAAVSDGHVVNSGLQALVAERKKANRELVSRSEEEEASRRRRERENELFKMLDQRKKATEGDKASPVKIPYKENHIIETTGGKTKEKPAATSFVDTTSSGPLLSLPPANTNTSKHEVSAAQVKKNMTNSSFYFCYYF